MLAKSLEEYILPVEDAVMEEVGELELGSPLGFGSYHDTPSAQHNLFLLSPFLAHEPRPDDINYDDIQLAGSESVLQDLNSEPEPEPEIIHIPSPPMKTLPSVVRMAPKTFRPQNSSFRPPRLAALRPPTIINLDPQYVEKIQLNYFLFPLILF